MSENPIEAIEEIIGKINSACDRKHGWIKDGEVAHWLVDNIVTRLITVRGQLGDKALVNHDNAVDVLDKVHDWLGVIIRDGKCDDHCKECIGASDLADDVWEVLHPAEAEAEKAEKAEAERLVNQPVKEPEAPMPHPTVERRIKALIMEQIGSQEHQLTPEASFQDDLGADSLDCVDLLMAAEEEFGICIPETDAEKLTTVGAAIEYFKSKGF